MAIHDILQAAAGSSGAKAYVDDVFSSVIYAGDRYYRSVSNGLPIGDGYENTAPIFQLSGNALTDQSSYRWSITYGTTALVSTPSKFGGGSLYFDDTAASLITAPINLCNTNNSSFEVSTWVRFNTLSNNGVIISQYPSATPPGRFFLRVDGTTIVFWRDGANRITSSTISTGVWYHVVFNWDGTNFRLFLDGVLQGTFGSAVLDNMPSEIGGNANLGSSYALAGYLEDFVVTQNQTVKTSNFTPPTAITAVPAKTSTGDGGLIWVKERGTNPHILVDTIRGVPKYLQTSSTAGQISSINHISSILNNKFFVATDLEVNDVDEYSAFSFLKSAKFFDVVTYTGNGSTQAINHSLGVAPGFVVVKRTDSTGSWASWHRSFTSGTYAFLNTAALPVSTSASNYFGNNTTTIDPSTASFTIGSNSAVNANAATYVAYLFAHDPSNFIACGSYVGAGAGTVANIGFEPQWILVKAISGSSRNWLIVDAATGFTSVEANTTSTAGAKIAVPDPNGIQWVASGLDYSASGVTYAYIAIRRSMRPATSGTDVLEIVARSGTSANADVGTTINPDAAIIKNRGATGGAVWVDRLRGAPYLLSSATSAEATATTVLQTLAWQTLVGVGVGSGNTLTNAGSNTYINYLFARKPKVFDVVCYTGTGANRTVSHNLTSVPELIILKQRSSTQAWTVGSDGIGWGDRLVLNTNAGETADSTAWNSTSPTNAVFSLGTSSATNANAATYVAYLFSTFSGISKVGTYTGNGTNQTIDCGFSAGARFVLIKRFDNTGSWYVWDSTRGIVVGNDPYFVAESTAAEVTSNDSVSPQSSGFGVIQSAITDINVNTATYIYLAIA